MQIPNTRFNCFLFNLTVWSHILDINYPWKSRLRTAPAIYYYSCIMHQGICYCYNYNNNHKSQIFSNKQYICSAQ